MTVVSLPWKPGVDWKKSVEKVLDYFDARPDLKFGAKNLNQAFPLIDTLCDWGCATQSHLNQLHKLSPPDDIATILGNVTMAIQGTGSVDPPEHAGWYVAIDVPCGYVVCPGFATSWNAARAWRRKYSQTSVPVPGQASPTMPALSRQSAVITSSRRASSEGSGQVNRRPTSDA
jgi:hypothetical protein